MRASRAFAVALVLLIAAAGTVQAKPKGASTAPGKYTDWGGEIDQLEILAGFALADFQRIVVEPFDTSSTPLPEAKDNTYAPVKQVLSDPAPSFVEGLGRELPTPPAAIAEAGGAVEPGTLLVRGSVVTMDPGSQAARYFAGFGAGAARTGIAGEVVDGGSGRVLLRFRQERRSGIGAFGGDYVKLMQRNLRAIGEDLAFVLKRF